MIVRNALVRAGLFSLLLGLCSTPLVAVAKDKVLSCPAGQVAQGIDLKAGTLSCVPLPAVPQGSFTCPQGQVATGVDFLTQTLSCAAVQSSAPPGPLKVVDSNNEEVGLLTQTNIVVRSIGTEWVGLPIAESGFVTSTFFYFLYEAENCSGTEYAQLIGHQFPPFALAVLGSGGFDTSGPVPTAGSVTVFYPVTGTTALRTIASIKAFSPNAAPVCHNNSFGSFSTTATQSFTLNMSPPFRIVR